MNYTVTGSAGNGTAYDTLGDPVDSAGEPSVTVFVNTIDLGLTSGSSTVVLTLGLGHGLFCRKQLCERDGHDC